MRAQDDRALCCSTGIAYERAHDLSSYALTCAALTVETVLLESVNSMKPTPLCFAYASKMRPTILLFEPANLDEASNRIPPTAHQRRGVRSKPKRCRTDRNRNVYANTLPGAGQVKSRILARRLAVRARRTPLYGYKTSSYYV